jgi:hypothetical protein
MKFQRLVVLAIGAMLAFSIPAMAIPSYDASVNGVVTEWQPVFSDNFDQDSGRWIYPTTNPTNIAQRTNGFMKITPATGTQTGAIWFDVDLKFAFQVEFDYRIGGGSGADGMVFMFYKDRNYTPWAGGQLGFISNSGASVSGYGLEFDTWYNGWGNEPGSNYLGIIKDHPSNHLATSYQSTMRNNAWHHIKIIVDDAAITVFFDDMVTPKITWTGTIDRSFGGFGFAAGTGGSTDNHDIDNVMLSKKVVYMVDDGNVVAEVQGEELKPKEAPAKESATWTMIAGNTAMLAIAVLVVLLVAHGLRRKRR